MNRGRDATGTARIRERVLLATWGLTALVMVGRAVEVQVVEHQAWLQDADGQHTTTQSVPGPRGRILDRNGEELVVNRWRARVGFNPTQVTDSAALAAALENDLGLPARRVREYLTPRNKWRQIPGDYSREQVQRLRAIRGVHVRGIWRRDYPHGALARGLRGTVQDGVGRGGVEASMNSVLTGQPGMEVVWKVSSGEIIPGSEIPLEPPAPGRDVVLTIDRDVQAIAEQALAEALDSTGARGGDIVITEPGTGKILALASVVDGVPGLSAVHTSFEPGSTAKTFTAAALLDHDLASLADSVDVGDGRWEVNGRVITDISGEGWMTLRDVLRESSNVGIAKFALALSPGQHYTALRSFGLGTPTGVPLPAEASGLLRRPAAWSSQSPQSLAFGYEVSATALQMAMAYGALANGGVLMQPLLVAEVRNPSGAVVRRNRTSPIRTVVSPSVADSLTSALVEVVDAGTGSRVRMSNYNVAGKSGTARAVDERGGYEENAYHSSFAAYFPADDPQMLIFVRLHRAQGRYYGGEIAAPVIMASLERFLAAGRSPLDLDQLLQVRRETGPAPVGDRVQMFAAARSAAPPALGRTSIGDRTGALRIPDLEGATLRAAVRRLHALGLWVRVEGSGAVTATVPAAGAEVAAGDTVRVVAGETEADVSGSQGDQE